MDGSTINSYRLSKSKLLRFLQTKVEQLADEISNDIRESRTNLPPKIEISRVEGIDSSVPLQISSTLSTSTSNSLTSTSSVESKTNESSVVTLVTEKSPLLVEVMKEQTVSSPSFKKPKFPNLIRILAKQGIVYGSQGLTETTFRG
jgi:hypothetical protein